MVTAIPMDLLFFLDEERTGNSRKEDETAKNENTKDKKKRSNCFDEGEVEETNEKESIARKSRQSSKEAGG